MPENLDAVYEILLRNVQPRLLDGFLTGELDEKAGRLYAATFVDISTIDYDDYGWLLSKVGSGGYGSTGVNDEKSRIYHKDGCYSYKDMNTCINEGIYRSFSVKFYGARVQHEWCILKELTYFGEEISEEKVKEGLINGYDRQSILNSGVYQPVEEYHLSIFKKEQLPVDEIEFAGLPWLAALLKKEEKLALNMAFTRYMNLEVFIPFKNRLIADHYEEFSEMHPLYSDDFIMIFPHTKEYMLIPAFVKNQRGEFRLYYFFWHVERKKMYKWTRFTPALHARTFFYADEILNDLKQVSAWNDYPYLNSSCTMDDDRFWREHVLAEENGRLRYLQEMPL